MMCIVKGTEDRQNIVEILNYAGKLFSRQTWD